MRWISYFRKELEKTAIPVGSMINAGFSLMDLQGTTKQRLSEAKLMPLRQQSQELQLPGSNSFQFEGSKGIDSTANQTSERF